MKSICIVIHELLLRIDMRKEECRSALSCSSVFLFAKSKQKSG